MPLAEFDAPDRQPDHVQRVVVREAVATLAAEERELVELAFYQGLSHSEVAARTGLPLGTVKTRLRRALAHLRGTLSEGEG